MKLFGIIAVLAFSSAVAKAQGDGTYSYTINAKRMSTMPADDTAVSISDRVEDGQTMRFYKPIDDLHPFTLQYEVEDSEDSYHRFRDDKPYNPCTDNGEDFWRDIATQIFIQGFLPNQSCAVAEGDYKLGVDVNPITVTSSEKINCGKYFVLIGAFAYGKSSVGLDYEFTIPDDDNCNTV